MRKKGDRSRDIMHRDDAVMSSLTRPYELVIDHGEGSTVYDVDSNSYLDFAAECLQQLITYRSHE